MINRDIILYIILALLGVSVGVVTNTLGAWQKAVLLALIVGVMVVFKVIITPEQKGKHDDNGIPDKH